MMLYCKIFLAHTITLKLGGTPLRGGAGGVTKLQLYFFKAIFVNFFIIKLYKFSIKHHLRFFTKLHKSPKFYNNVFLFVGLATLGTFIEVWFVGSLGWVLKRFNHLFLSTEVVILCIMIGNIHQFFRPLSYPFRSLSKNNKFSGQPHIISFYTLAPPNCKICITSYWLYFKFNAIYKKSDQM